jgi:putative redox protein
MRVFAGFARRIMQTASVKWVTEQQFLGVSPSGHAMVMDADSKSNKASNPMEMLLLALGGCTASDMVSILEKKRQNLQSLVVECSGERAHEPPRVWVKIDVLFRLRGTLNEQAVQHALELTKEKYCSVAAMLNKTAEVSWKYEIQPAQ